MLGIMFSGDGRGNVLGVVPRIDGAWPPSCGGNGHHRHGVLLSQMRAIAHTAKKTVNAAKGGLTIPTRLSVVSCPVDPPNRLNRPLLVALASSFAAPHEAAPPAGRLFRP